ncbi:hypothetical protein BY996DRAFT_6424063 [Phakopsora pachyrhizi]|uniref:Expressed protein n=1 Tax=Phakopsora pachyrhizi TaxID=170000 RepID=A0AAV0BMM2_PHAPC|nr:hypothetical protein BY996DRAFT_6424063 [Phakopsora pachyrhizi]CAH7687888.1 expressed protein [Phakopsora pachyrhizi]
MRKDGTESFLVSSVSSESGTLPTINPGKKAKKSKQIIKFQRVGDKRGFLSKPSRQSKADISYSWVPSHYVPHSFAFSMESPGFSTLTSSPIDMIHKKKTANESLSQSISHQNQSVEKTRESAPKKLKAQAKHAFGLLLKATRISFLTGKKDENHTHKTAQHSNRSKHIYRRKKSNKLSVQSLPTISYPMRLHAEPEFVTTHDPWDSSIRSANIHPQAGNETINKSQPTRRGGSVKSLSHCSNKDSVRNSVARNSIKSSHRHFSTGTTAAILASKTGEDQIQRDKKSMRGSVSSRRVSRLSQDSRPLSRQLSSVNPRNLQRLDAQRLSLHHHPPLRLSLASRASVSYPISFEVAKAYDETCNLKDQNQFTSVSTRNSSLRNYSHRKRQSWAAGERPTIESRSSKYSRSSFISEKSLPISSNFTSDRQSLANSSDKLRSITDWSGVIEEDVTLTLMGCPRSSFVTPKRSKRIKSIEKVFQKPPSPAPLSPAPPPSPPPATAHKVEKTHPAPIPIQKKSEVVQAFKPISNLRPLSLMFPRISSNVSSSKENDLNQQRSYHYQKESDRKSFENYKSTSEWYSDLMNLVEQSISKI